MVCLALFYFLRTNLCASSLPSLYLVLVITNRFLFREACQKQHFSLADGLKKS